MEDKDVIRIDLIRLIELVVDQVWGSDERDLLERFLDRNTETEQPVEFRLSDVLTDSPVRRRRPV